MMETATNTMMNFTSVFFMKGLQLQRIDDNATPL